MGFTSLVGVVVKNLSTGLQPNVYENWLAAAPVVALGAPMGVFVVNIVGRKPTLRFVAILCIGQFLWTCSTARRALGLSGIVLAIAAIALCLFGFEKLRSWGAVLVGEDLARLSTQATPDQQSG